MRPAQPSDDSSPSASSGSSGSSDKQPSSPTPSPSAAPTASSRLRSGATSSTTQKRKQQRLVPVYPRRRPIPRKGHTKSRAGCSVCKGRKVKCDEAVPECGPCRRLGLACDYAQRKRSRDAHSSSYGDSSSSHEGDGDAQAMQLAAGGSRMSLARSPSATPTLFEIEDMRFFHHFIFSAHPPLPIGGAWAWRQISQMSYQVSITSPSPPLAPLCGVCRWKWD
jgi:hypothetical protein